MRIFKKKSVAKLNRGDEKDTIPTRSKSHRESWFKRLAPKVKHPDGPYGRSKSFSPSNDSVSDDQWHKELSSTPARDDGDPQELCVPLSTLPAPSVNTARSNSVCSADSFATDDWDMVQQAPFRPKLMVKINPLAAEDSALTTPQSAKIPAVLAPPSSYGPAGQDLWTHLSCQEDRPQMNNFSAGSFSSNCSFEGNDVGNAVSKSTFDSKEEGVSMESFNSVIEFDVVDAANKSSHDSNRGEELFVSWLEGLEISRLSSNTGAQNEQKVLDKNAPQDNTETGRGGGEVQLEGTSGGEYSPRQSLELGVDTDEVAKNSAGPNSPILETGEIGREALSSKSEEDQCVRNNPVFCRGSSLPAVASLKEESQSLDVLETRVNWYEALAVERLQQTKTLKNQLDVLLTDYTTLKNELQSNQGCHEQYPVPDPLANCEYQQEADEVQRLRADLILAKTDLGLCRDLINEQAVQIRGLEEQIAKERQSRQKPELKAGKNCASGSIVADLLEHLDECSGALDILVKENTDMRSRVSLHQNKDLTPERQGNARIIKTLRKENEDLKLELSKVQGDLGKAKKAVDVLTRERNNLEKEASKRGRDLKERSKKVKDLQQQLSERAPPPNDAMHYQKIESCRQPESRARDQRTVCSIQIVDDYPPQHYRSNIPKPTFTVGDKLTTPDANHPSVQVPCTTTHASSKNANLSRRHSTDPQGVRKESYVTGGAKTSPRTAQPQNMQYESSSVDLRQLRAELSRTQRRVKELQSSLHEAASVSREKDAAIAELRKDLKCTKVHNKTGWR